MKTNRTYMPIIGLIFLILMAITACSQNPMFAQVSTTPISMNNNWDDREIFRAGLIKDEQKALNQLPGASVYHLTVQIADDLTSLQGQERVRYTNREDKPLDAVYFQLFPNMAGGKSGVSAVKVDGQDVQPVYESENSTARIPLPVQLQVGQSVVIQMDFKVEVPTEVGGNYGLFGYLNHILVLDGFYPAIPVYDEKGWHDGKVPPNADTTFQDASFYVVRVTAPDSLTIVASGIKVDGVKKGNSQVVTFAAGPARDFYMAASDRFDVISEKVGETTVNSYALEGLDEGSQSALNTAVSALKSYSTRFGAYPYTEFDVVSTPMQGATGIEYPGITGINYAVYDPSAVVNGVSAPVMLEATVAHEVGHQWFYNVVGNDQANEPWLDEAVTQYVTGLYFLDMYGRQGMDGYRDSWVSRWERVNRDPMPIGLPAGSYQGKEYGAIVYGRGPLFIEALEQKMGQDSFNQFLRDYYQSHKWGIGTAVEFKQSAEKQCNCDLTPLFDEWVNASGASVPSAPTNTVEVGGAYLGQPLPGLTPQVFAPGIVSIPSAVDYAGTFSSDGTEFYFTRRIGENQNIYETHLADGAWSTPSPVSFSAGYEAHEPHLTLDNKTLYFGWFRPLPPEEKSSEDYGIWAVDRTGSSWSTPRYVGKGMFVSSDQGGQIYVTDLKTRSVCKVSLTDGRFTDWEYITAGIHPAIAPDGGYLVYDDGNGHLRVRFHMENGSWSAAKDLTAQGIPASASIASISPDGKFLFYGDSGDLYWVSTELIKNLKED